MNLTITREVASELIKAGDAQLKNALAIFIEPYSNNEWPVVFSESNLGRFLGFLSENNKNLVSRMTGLKLTLERPYAIVNACSNDTRIEADGLLRDVNEKLGLGRDAIEVINCATKYDSDKARGFYLRGDYDWILEDVKEGSSAKRLIPLMR